MIFDMKGEGSTPPHLLSMCFDTIGEGATPPHSFQPLLTWTGRIQPLPPCYQHDSTQLRWAQVMTPPHSFRPLLTQTGRVQPLPTLLSMWFDAIGVGATPPHPFWPLLLSMCFNAMALHLFLDPIQRERGGFNPSLPVSTWFDANREGATPPHSFQPLSKWKGRVQPLPTCFQSVSTWTERVQPLPACFWPVLRHEEGYGMGLTPPQPFLTCSDTNVMGSIPPDSFSMSFDTNRMGSTPPHPFLMCQSVLIHFGTLNFIYNFYLIYNILIFWSNPTVTQMRDPIQVYQVWVASSGAQIVTWTWSKPDTIKKLEGSLLHVGAYFTVNHEEARWKSEV